MLGSETLRGACKALTTVLTLVLLTPFLMCSRRASARPMTPEDVSRLVYLGEVAVSPNGRTVAFARNALPDLSKGEKNGGFKTSVYVTENPLSSEETVPREMDVGSLAFSPDGRILSFLWRDREEDDHRGVYGMKVGDRGGGWRKIASLEDSSIHRYAWLPDGQSLLCVAGRPRVEADDLRRDERRLGFTARVHEEERSDNRVLAVPVEVGEGLFEDEEEEEASEESPLSPRTEAGEEEGEGEAKDVSEPPREISLSGYKGALRVSADGSLAAVSVTPTSAVDERMMNSTIHIVRVSDGSLVRTVDTEGKIGDFDLSPDGQILAFIAGVDVHDPGATTLYMTEAARAGGELKGVNEGKPEAVTDIAWSGNSRLAAVVHKGARSLLRLYDRYGAVLDETEGGELIFTSVRPAGGGAFFLRAHHPTHPTELFLLSANKTVHRWTDTNPWLSDLDFGAQRTVTYTARDGQAIEGVLVEPVGGVPEGGAPTIFDIHGGPESHESNGWVTGYTGPGQIAAGRGYAVFLPNYRGSTGYGVAFSKDHQRDYGGKEFNDIVDAIQPLQAEGVLDPSRVGITGGSYGGFATAWASTNLTDLFVAGVMSIGISNQVSKWGTTDIPNEMFLVHARLWPWDDWLWLLERSPVFYAGQARTPLLILHGEEDTRVSPSQSEELYRHIKVRTDTPVRLVTYPGEGHGNRNAASRYDFNLRMLEWFEVYLKSGDRKAPLPPPSPDLSLILPPVNASSESEAMLNQSRTNQDRLREGAHRKPVAPTTAERKRETEIFEKTGDQAVEREVSPHTPSPPSSHSSWLGGRDDLPWDASTEEDKEEEEDLTSSGLSVDPLIFRETKGLRVH
uniref:Peptidase S9 prolyl oligopeptidase catalytic domain-containing protein n=1 Tax=Chromera velia CCMP2878 TaxID=1169474 RepID=A0A0G4HGK0_9ALVE|eukprot:Cvel_27228.t1-p1 / transcript=Cvel_27228.t1 / gene=Cvel_27228 / organism=Chromera_velia_CCMP2878 / gene_product=Uncharacterized peptidase YuxL, putative / transcript_product=Uncharacterized peptidase YuxL, putative / location=Cvel_scaffold3368:5956-14211(-) / protein_length=849 / sequence_SO=supercontig / SO=protein_coding / is_pseudo=false